MVARVEDCFLGKEQGFGSQYNLPWKWNQGARDVDLLHMGESLHYGGPRQLNGDHPGVAAFAKGLQHPLNPAIITPESDHNDALLLNSFVSSYLAAQRQVTPGRVGTNTLAPGAQHQQQVLARNASFESITNTTASCSTPRLISGGSPPQAFSSHPSDQSEVLLRQSDPRAINQPQLSDHSLSNDSLSYGVDEYFWNAHDMVADHDLLPEFRLEPMLDDTAHTGAGAGSFSVAELDSFHASPAPDVFCQSFLVGGDEGDNFLKAKLHSGGDRPGQRLRWCDQPWSSPGNASGASTDGAQISKPSSPTSPLDGRVFANASAALQADELQKKLSNFQGAGNKRSFGAMQSGSGNADKFDAAALSALLYSNVTSQGGCVSRDEPSPPPKQRRRHGTATDPQSIAARTRREKFSDRIRVLQSLVPNGERLDTVHMLSQTFEYVRFLQHKVWDLYNGKDSIADVKCEKWKEFVDAATGQVIV